MSPPRERIASMRKLRNRKGEYRKPPMPTVAVSAVVSSCGSQPVETRHRVSGRVVESCGAVGSPWMELWGAVGHPVELWAVGSG